MGSYVVGRVVQACIVVWLVATVVFAVVRLTPGDPAQQIAGAEADRETVQQLREQLGLDRSLGAQYASYLGLLIRADMGESLVFREPAVDLVRHRLANTLKLALVALSISVGFGAFLGVMSAARAGGVIDRTAQLFAVFGQSMPTFWIGLLFILIFAVNLSWLPTSGTGSWKHYILPATTLGWFSMAAMVRLTRSAILDELHTDYVRLLQAKGLSWQRIMFQHALRNASLPVLTLASLQLVAFFSGSVVVETVFAWPGLGRLLIDAIYARDYPVVQAATLLFAVLLVVVNLVIDLCYAVIDPRIRYGASS